MKKVMEIHYDDYKGGLYEFIFRENELPGIAICPICGHKHMSMAKEILTLKFNRAPICFRCKATHFKELLSEADIEYIVEAEFLEEEETKNE